MRKLTWKSHCRHLTKLIKLGNAARFFWCINILLLLQQGGKTDKCSNCAFMCVLFQACVALWGSCCCVCSKRLCNCSENSWNFSDMCIFSWVKAKRTVSFCYSVIKEYSCLLITRVALSPGVLLSKVGGSINEHFSQNMLCVGHSWLHYVSLWFMHMSLHPHAQFWVVFVFLSFISLPQCPAHSIFF